MIALAQSLFLYKIHRKKVDCSKKFGINRDYSNKCKFLLKFVEKGDINIREAIDSLKMGNLAI